VIEVVLEDGTKRMLDQAEVKFTWTDADGAEHEYGLDEVKALILYDPEMGTQVGMWSGMPIMGVRFTDASDLRIETPLPLGFANDLGHQLVKDTDRFAEAIKQVGGDTKKGIERYQSLPAGLPEPPV
jgi:hypothetical protein